MEAIWPFPNAVSGSRTCEFRRICHKNPLQAKASIMHENYPSATRVDKQASSHRVLYCLNIRNNSLYYKKSRSHSLCVSLHFFFHEQETSGMSNLTSCDFYTRLPCSASMELARGNEKVEFYDTLYYFSHGLQRSRENLKTTLRSDDITPLWPKTSP